MIIISKCLQIKLSRGIFSGSQFTYTPKDSFLLHWKITFIVKWFFYFYNGLFYTSILYKYNFYWCVCNLSEKLIQLI